MPHYYRASDAQGKRRLKASRFGQPPIQAAHPAAGVFSTADAERAVRTRRAMLAHAADANLLAASMHIECPGIARAIGEGSGSRRVPARPSGNGLQTFRLIGEKPF